MEALLQFFADLILFTAGLAVTTFWLVVIIGICVEIYDLVKGDKSRTLGEEEL